VGTKALLKAIGTFLLIVASTGSNAQTVDFDYLLLARSEHEFKMYTRVLDTLRLMEDDTTARETDKHGSDWYRTLVEEVNDLATVVDPDGTITYVSPAITKT
jgi:PAS domain-containing protein